MHSENSAEDLSRTPSGRPVELSLLEIELAQLAAKQRTNAQFEVFLEDRAKDLDSSKPSKARQLARVEDPRLQRIRAAARRPLSTRHISAVKVAYRKDGKASVLPQPEVQFKNVLRTQSEIADFLGVSPQTVSKLIRFKGLPAFRLPGGAWMSFKALIYHWTYSQRDNEMLKYLERSSVFALEDPEQIDYLMQTYGLPLATRHEVLTQLAAANKANEARNGEE